MNLESIILPVVTAQGVELYDMEYVKEGGERILRLYIDKGGGVDLNDCERVSRAVSDKLDEDDPISESYRLQVGSPGIERKLSKPEHFTKYLGEKIQVKLYAPHNPKGGGAESVTTGRKKFTGRLTAYENNAVTLIDIDNNVWIFSADEIANCRLLVFDQD